MRRRSVWMGLSNISHYPTLKSCAVQRYYHHIWKLQSWLLKEADQDGIPIIENLQVADTVRAVLDHVVEQVMKAFPPQAGERVWEV